MFIRLGATDGYKMEVRMTALETRFDTILPTLATKEDLKDLELKLTHTIHREITSSTWKMIGWMTAVMGMGFTGVFYVARYIAPV